MSCPVGYAFSLKSRFENWKLERDARVALLELATSIQYECSPDLSIIVECLEFWNDNLSSSRLSITSNASIKLRLLSELRVSVKDESRPKGSVLSLNVWAAQQREIYIKSAHKALERATQFGISHKDALSLFESTEVIQILTDGSLFPYRNFPVLLDTGGRVISKDRDSWLALRKIKHSEAQRIDNYASRWLNCV